MILSLWLLLIDQYWCLENIWWLFIFDCFRSSSRRILFIRCVLIHLLIIFIEIWWPHDHFPYTISNKNVTFSSNIKLFRKNFQREINYDLKLDWFIWAIFFYLDDWIWYSGKGGESSAIFSQPVGYILIDLIELSTTV